MRTAPRSYADADTTRSPPTPAGYDGAPAHGPGHAREQRLPRPQARLVLPGLQPALLPAARGPRGLCPPGDARALRTGLCPAHARAVGHCPAPGSRRGPHPGRAARLLDQAPCPAYPELSALLRRHAPRARHAALQAAPARTAVAPALGGGRTMLSITRYRNTHYWALWEGGQLLAVTVYKKGAVTLMRRLQQARRNTR